jgi:hypothetical protein
LLGTGWKKFPICRKVRAIDLLASPLFRKIRGLENWRGNA